MSHHVYQLYDASGTLLYVGYTSHPAKRFVAHARERTWWADVARREIEDYPSRVEALAREKALISETQPRYNAMHHPAAIPKPERGFVESPGTMSEMWVTILRDAGAEWREAIRERDAYIAEVVRAGGSLREVGEAVGLSHAAVARVVRRAQPA